MNGEIYGSVYTYIKAAILVKFSSLITGFWCYCDCSEEGNFRLVGGDVLFFFGLAFCLAPRYYQMISGN
jgi:hypothetical protein